VHIDETKGRASPRRLAHLLRQAIGHRLLPFGDYLPFVDQQAEGVAYRASLRPRELLELGVGGGSAAQGSENAFPRGLLRAVVQWSLSSSPDTRRCGRRDSRDARPRRFAAVGRVLRRLCRPRAPAARCPTMVIRVPVVMADVRVGLFCSLLGPSSPRSMLNSPLE
jgi:hypothetical protein